MMFAFDSDRLRFALVPILALGLGACGLVEDAVEEAKSDLEEELQIPTDSVLTDLDVPETYAFASGFVTGEGSVSYSGQIFRHVLISDLTTEINTMTADIDGGDFEPTAEGDVVAALDFYYRFDSASSGDLDILLETDPAAAQQTYNDISSDKDLAGKTAGNDDVTDHKDWDGGGFAGWSDTGIADYGGGIDSPEAFVLAMFETMEANALGRVNGDFRFGVDGYGNAQSGPANALPVHVTTTGVDLSQLVQKFLLMAITYSQGTDDYLDDATDGKGILSTNAEQDEDAPFSPLEHQWDEGFGYFGAAQNYLDYSDEEIADGVAKDADGDGAIDLLSEYNFGQSVNAGKRDAGASDDAPTDFTALAFEAFVEGRAIINAAAGRELLEPEMIRLQELRDQAVDAWERAIAATAVHYINDTLQDMGKFDTDDYSFLDHAKHFSELKGFALGLQFNPRSQLTDTEFAEFHELIGDRPVLPNASDTEIDAYAEALVEARTILGDAYGFAGANLGADDGTGGW